MHEIDDGYSVPFKDYLLRPLTWQERHHLTWLINNKKAMLAEDFLLMPGRVNDLNGRPVDVVDEEVQQEIAEQLLNWPSEADDIQNLRKAGQLMMKHPLLGVRSCQICKTWWFDEDTQKIVSMGGKSVKRPPHAPVSCDTDAGCLKGHHSNPVELSERNFRAWEHWLEYRWVGCPRPFDAIMRRNWKWLSAMADRYGLGKDRRTSRNKN